MARAGGSNRERPVAPLTAVRLDGAEAEPVGLSGLRLLAGPCSPADLPVMALSLLHHSVATKNRAGVKAVSVADIRGIVARCLSGGSREGGFGNLLKDAWRRWASHLAQDRLEAADTTKLVRQWQLGGEGRTVPLPVSALFWSERALRGVPPLLRARLYEAQAGLLATAFVPDQAVAVKAEFKALWGVAEGEVETARLMREARDRLARHVETYWSAHPYIQWNPDEPVFLRRFVWAGF